MWRVELFLVAVVVMLGLPALALLVGAIRAYREAWAEPDTSEFAEWARVRACDLAEAEPWPELAKIGEGGRACLTGQAWRRLPGPAAWLP